VAWCSFIEQSKDGGQTQAWSRESARCASCVDVGDGLTDYINLLLSQRFICVCFFAARLHFYSVVNITFFFRSLHCITVTHGKHVWLSVSFDIGIVNILLIYLLVFFPNGKFLR